jgi:hypothetical protein
MAWTDGNYSDIIQTHEAKAGLFFVLNSGWPRGLGLADGLLPGAARFFSGRQIMGTDNDPATLPPEEKSIIWGTAVTTDHGTLTAQVRGASGYCHAAYGSDRIVSGQRIGGLWRIRRKPAVPVTEADFSVSGDGVYVGPWADARGILVDHAFDTHLRPGTNDFGERILNTSKEFYGPANANFDELFSSAGQELAFIPGRDCNVYMHAAVELSRGSAAQPVRKFVSGRKCKIAVKIPAAPFPDAVIGVAGVPNVSADWARVNHLWISKILGSGNRDGADLAEYLDLVRVDDPTAYEISAQEMELLLRPGDWIWADKVPCRIRKTLEMPGRTTIHAGKKYLDLSTTWGEWRNAAGSIDHTNLIQSQKIDWQTDNGSQTFIVLAAEKGSQWRARLKLSWAVELLSVTGGGTQTSSTGQTATCIPSGSFTAEDDAIYQIDTVPDTSGYTRNLWHWKKLPDGSWSSTERANVVTEIENGAIVNFTGMFPYSNNVIPTMTWYVWAASHIDSIGSPILVVKVNDVVVPPGRISLPDPLSGSIDIDITDMCIAGENTLTAAVLNGMSEAAYPNHFHSLTGSIDQYQRAGVLENA